MRKAVTIKTGQVWMSGDSRRLFAFRIKDIGQDHVTVDPVYPRKRQDTTIPIRKFLETGSKGYVRQS